jgi:hypothetical protein
MLRRLSALAVAVALLVVCADRVRGAGALVGVFTAGEQSGGGTTITTGSRTTSSGNLITGVSANWRNLTGQNLVISDSSANTYTEAQEIEVGSFVNLVISYNANGTRGASHTVTMTTGNADTGRSIGAQEWSGVDASPTVVSAQASGSSTAPSVSVSPGSASLCVGAVAYDGSATTISQNGGTEAQEVDENNDNQAINIAYKTSQSGSISIAWTLGASRTWGAVIACFTESGGGGGGSAPKAFTLLGVGGYE